MLPALIVIAHSHRWVRDARELRLQRRVQRMRLQSDAAQLQREIEQMHNQFNSERRLQQSLERQLRDTQRARLANSTNQSGQWQLGAVQLYHNRVVQAAPVRVSLVGHAPASAQPQLLHSPQSCSQLLFSLVTLQSPSASCIKDKVVACICTDWQDCIPAGAPESTVNTTLVVSRCTAHYVWVPVCACAA